MDFVFGWPIKRIGGFYRFAEEMEATYESLVEFIVESEKVLSEVKEKELEPLQSKFDANMKKVKIEERRLIDQGEDHMMAYSIAKDTQGLPEFYQDEISSLDGIRFKYASIFDHLYKSSFLVAYGIFENELKKLCLLCREFKNYKIAPEDIAGQGYIATARKYLELVVELPFPSLGEDASWDRMQKFRKVRNCIAHDNSRINNWNKQFSEQIIRASNKSLRLCDGTIQMIKNDYLISFIEESKKYLEHLIWVVEKKYNYPRLQGQIIGILSGGIFTGPISKRKIKSLNYVGNSLECHVDMKSRDLELGYIFALKAAKGKNSTLFKGLFQKSPPQISESLEKYCVEIKKREGYFRKAISEIMKISPKELSIEFTFSSFE